MSIFYMDHPKYGTHICYDTSEVERREKEGWVLRGEKAAVPQTEATPIKKKGGRPRKIVQ